MIKSSAASCSSIRVGRERALGVIAPDRSQRRRLFRIIKARPHVCADLAASCAGEQRFEIRKPDIIGPSLGADACRVRAMIIGTTDQEIAHAECAHFAQRLTARANDLMLQTRNWRSGPICHCACKRSERTMCGQGGEEAVVPQFSWTHRTRHEADGAHISVQ
jgi:hypothetical protein